MSNPEENIEPMNLAEADTGDDEDHNYVPSFIAKLLDNPQLLPSYYREDFEFIFEKFEFSHLGEAKTTLEYIEVYQATMLTLDIERYEHMKDAILLNQRRPAVEALFRKTHEGAAMAGAEQAVRSSRQVVRSGRLRAGSLGRRSVPQRSSNFGSYRKADRPGSEAAHRSLKGFGASFFCSQRREDDDRCENCLTCPESEAFQSRR
jgi:hypothetical protein